MQYAPTFRRLDRWKVIRSLNGIKEVGFHDLDGPRQSRPSTSPLTPFCWRYRKHRLSRSRALSDMDFSLMWIGSEWPTIHLELSLITDQEGSRPSTRSYCSVSFIAR